jgi:hypothetical protein
MKRLVEETAAPFSALSELVRAAEPLQIGPFSKRLVQSRLARAVSGPAGDSTPAQAGKRRLQLRPALLGAGAVLIAASAAAAGYGLLLPSEPDRAAPPVAPVAPPRVQLAPKLHAPSAAALPEPALPAEKTNEQQRVTKPLAGEDPTQVAEAVRALRKQGDPARAQQLLDRYLKGNPRGALAEDALALSIEAAAARKDPRAAEYARRYLARYPNGRFRTVAERALAR